MPTPPEDRTEIETVLHEDGSATVYLPQGENLDRVSLCVRCFEPIGDGPYAITAGIAKMAIHEACVVEGDHVVERHGPRA